MENLSVFRRYLASDADGAVSFAFRLFDKLYKYRHTLDALRLVIPILKGELKKHDEGDKKKDAELLKFRKIVDNNNN